MTEHLRMPTDFIYNDANPIGAKIAHFGKAGPNGIHMVFDFDRTLTITRPGSVDDITTWQIMQKHLPPEGQKRYQQSFDYHRALELDGSMNQEHAVTWFSSSLNLFVEYGVNLREVENDFLKKATIRPEAKELFDLCEQAGIPTIIMSAGIKEVINIWARAYQIHPTIVLSTELQIDPAGVVKSWDKSSLVHVLNKTELSHPELSKIREVRPLAILIGDGLADADMAAGDDTVLRIRVYDPRADEKTDQAAVHSATFSRFDLMIESGTLRPIRLLLERLINDVE